MDAADAGPQHVACFREVGASVERRLHFTAQDEIRLLERVIVEPDAHARLVLDEQHAVVPRADLLVDQPPEKHALQSAGGDPSLLAAGNLAHVEVSEQRLLRCLRRGVEPPGVGRHRRARRKERVAAAAVRLRLRRAHLQPAHRLRADVPPSVRRPDLQRAVVAGAEQKCAVVDGDRRVAGENVEAFLVRMHVRRERPARRELADRQAGVDRPRGAVHELGFGVAVAVPRVARMRHQRVFVERAEVMHEASGDPFRVAEARLKASPYRYAMRCMYTPLRSTARREDEVELHGVERRRDPTLLRHIMDPVFASVSSVILCALV